MQKHVRTILVGVFLVLLFVGVLIIRLLYRSSSSAPVSDSVRSTIAARPMPEAETVYTAETIAKSALLFLNAQRRVDGLYHYFSHYETLCPKTVDPVNCPLGDKNVREEDTVWIILARLAYYERFSHDPADLVMAQKDAASFLSYCSQTTTGCLATPLVLLRLYDATKDETYRSTLNSLTHRLRNPTQLDVSGLALEARSLAALSKPDLARQRLGLAQSQALEEAAQWTDAVYPYTCDLTLAQIAVAASLPDSAYLQEAAGTLRSHSLGEFSTQTGIIAGCVESAFLLGDALPDSQLKQQATDTLHQLVIDRWDEPGYPRAFGEGGFLSDDGSNVVTVSDAAQMIIILSHAPKEVYPLPARKNI